MCKKYKKTLLCIFRHYLEMGFNETILNIVFLLKKKGEKRSPQLDSV